MTCGVDAVVLDIDGLLRRTAQRDEGWRSQHVRQIFELLGSDVRPGDFSTLLSHRAKAYKHWSEETLVELNEVDFWTQWMLPEWPADKVRSLALQVDQIWRDANGASAIPPETKEVVLELFRRGYRLGLVSNTTSSLEIPRALGALRISGCLETVVLSCEFGRRKPDPAVLQAATQRMGIPPERCAYFGVCPDRTVASAKRSGFATTVMLCDPREAAMRPVDPSYVPEHVVDNLKDLLEIFPPHGEEGAMRPEGELPLYDVAFSTMWANGKFPSLGDFFLAAPRLGFSTIELNHQVTAAMLAGVELTSTRFCSVHEPCPAEFSSEFQNTHDWLISAQEEENRRKGVESIKPSINLAHDVQAQAVVVHAGNVPSDPALEDSLRAIYRNGQSGSREYREVLDRLVKSRAGAAGPCLEAVKKSLVELLEYAARFDVRLGLENRYHYVDIPGLDEMGVLLSLAGPDQLGFIYDVGHAQTLDRLGFYPHEDWLKRYASRMIGAHLHDVIGISDHHAPGLGEVDFDMVATYLPAGAFRTLEVDPDNTTDQVKAGLRFLVEHGCLHRVPVTS